MAYPLEAPKRKVQECITACTTIRAIYLPSESTAATTPASAFFSQCSAFFSRFEFLDFCTLPIQTAKQTTCLKHGRNKSKTRVSQIPSHAPLSSCFSGWKWMIFYVGFCWQNMQQTLDHESYTATWYGSCKRRRGQYMPIWLIPVPGDSSKPLKALRYCFRVWRVNSRCKTHAQPGWCFHVCRLFSNFSLSRWSFPSETSSSSMRPESFHVDNHFASKNSQGDFQGWEATRRKLQNTSYDSYG